MIVTMTDLRLAIIWLNAILIACTLCAVISRAGRKILVVGKFGWHDGFIVLAAVCSSLYHSRSSALSNITAGISHHILDFSNDWYRSRSRRSHGQRKPGEYARPEQTPPRIKRFLLLLQLGRETRSPLFLL